MTPKLYMIALEDTESGANSTKLKSRLRGTPAVSAWWNHLTSTFLVRTTLTAEELTGLTKRATGDASFLVMAVDPTDSQGWLPEQAWAWIKKHAAPSGSHLSEAG